MGRRQKHIQLVIEAVYLVQHAIDIDKIVLASGIFAEPSLHKLYLPLERCDWRTELMTRFVEKPLASIVVDLPSRLFFGSCAQHNSLLESWLRLQYHPGIVKELRVLVNLCTPLSSLIIRMAAGLSNRCIMGWCGAAGRCRESIGR